MEINSTSEIPNMVPPQKKSLASKLKNDKQWFKDCILGYEELSMQNEAELHRKMQIWIDLDNDIIDIDEIERVFNPMELEHAAFPAATKNYPIIVPMIDLLQGEEANRSFEFMVKAKNDDTNSSQSQDAMEMFMQILIQEVQSKGYDEEKFKRRIKGFDKFLKYDWKTTHEIAATRILEYLYREQDLKYKFNKGFRFGPMAAGREIYRIDDEGDEPIVEVCDPRNVYVIRPGNTDKIEDAEAIIEVEYMSVSSVIDSFYDYLKPSEIDALEQGVYHGITKANGVLNHENIATRIYSNLDFGDGPGFLDLSQFGADTERFGLPYDEDGNVRVIRARWMSRKKIGVLTFINPITGMQDERIVSENFRPNKDLGESVKWMWVNEAMEGTHIAEDIWVKLQPRKIQRRHFDNKSRAFLGYVGHDYGKSLISRLEPYQYQYNVYMRKLELLMAKYKGPIYELDLAKIPDDWDIDKWMYYAEVLGWAPLDNFNEAKKGIATGKLSGAFNTTGKVLDANIGNVIQQVVMFLQYIENQIHEIAGVTKQRLGNISNRETAQGVERSVTQSSHTTEKWFFPHDEVKKRVLEALLDTAKFMWAHNDSKKLNYVLDDLSQVFIEFSPSEIASSEFDVFVTNSSKDEMAKQMIQSTVQPAIAKGASLKLAIDVSRADSVTQAAKLIEQAEEETFRRQQEEAEANRQNMLKIKQLDDQAKQREEQLKVYEIDKKSATDIEKAKISAGFYDDNEAENLSEEAKAAADQSKLDLERDKLEETKRHNMETEKINSRKVTTANTVSKN